MTKFKCPCQVCPRCDYDRDYEWHPDDGLAYCGRCHLEWWVSVGPVFGAKKCPKSAEELWSWYEYDNALLRAQEERERLSDLSLL